MSCELAFQFHTLDTLKNLQPPSLAENCDVSSTFPPSLEKQKATFVRRYLRPAEAILIKLQDSTARSRTEGWLSCDEDWIVFG